MYAVPHSTTSDLEGPTGHGHDGIGSGCGRRRVRECKLLDDSRVIVMLQTPAGLGRPFGHGHGCIGSGRGRRVGIHFCVMDRIPGENFLYIVFEIAKYEPYVLCYMYCLYLGTSCHSFSPRFFAACLMRPCIIKLEICLLTGEMGWSMPSTSIYDPSMAVFILSCGKIVNTN